VIPPPVYTDAIPVHSVEGIVRIFLISGDPAFCDKLSKFLQTQSDIASCYTARNGLTAVVTAAKCPPDLILLEADALPGALKTADALKRTLPKLPVFLITTGDIAQAEKIAWSHGVSAVFQKEEDFSSLIENIRAVCGRGIETKEQQHV